nr:uracil phosphoribosyltransferase [Desulfobulbus oralis]
MAVCVVDHPLVRHKLGILRMASTATHEFRPVANELARLLIYEATSESPACPLQLLPDASAFPQPPIG